MKESLKEKIKNIIYEYVRYNDPEFIIDDDFLYGVVDEILQEFALFSANTIVADSLVKLHGKSIDEVLNKNKDEKKDK